MKVKTYKKSNTRDIRKQLGGLREKHGTLFFSQLPSWGHSSKDEGFFSADTASLILSPNGCGPTGPEVLLGRPLSSQRKSQNVLSCSQKEPIQWYFDQSLLDSRQETINLFFEKGEIPWLRGNSWWCSGDLCSARDRIQVSQLGSKSLCPLFTLWP